MHFHSLDPWTHDHVYLGARHARNERRTWFVVALTAVMMVGEIVAGILFGSMALLADGWHMATHAAALGIAALAYLFARRQARNTQFTFGTGKFGDLAAFASAVILGIVAIQIAFESFERLVNPVAAPSCCARSTTMITTAMVTRTATTTTTTSAPLMSMSSPTPQPPCSPLLRW
jgi:cation diffusion facilitator family transporter